MTSISHERISVKQRAPAWRAAVVILKLWYRRIVTRHQLRKLDARQLLDIGCTEYERYRECRKWFWQ